VKFRVINFTARLETVAGPKIDDLFPNEIVEDTGKTSGAFMEVDPGDGVKGWALQADFEPVGAGSRPPVDRAAFIQECIAVERSLNDQPKTAPWFVLADFVIARALLETDITNAGPKLPGSDAAGPLQVSSEEWKAFLKNGGPLAKNFLLAQFDDPIRQIRGATYRMSADAKAISDGKTTIPADPFIPSYLDIFHAHLTNSPQAAIAILDAAASAQNGGKPIDQVLAGKLTDPQIDSLFAARAVYTGARAQPKSVSDFVAATESSLKGALEKALDLIKQFAPEELTQVQQGEAPWFDFAETLIGIKEPDPKILEYFKATDFRPLPTSTDTPWCGAFVAHCLANSGSPGKGTIPAGSARAANWQAWGVGLPLESKDVPRGAIVVLAPAPGTGSSGHVAFFDSFLDDGRIQLLGGNQSNAVTRKAFPPRIRAIRWLDLAPEVSAQQFDGDASGSPISDRAFNLIVEFEVTSKPVYEKRYRHPEWPGGRSGVTIGIGYDVGYATKDQLSGDWTTVIPNPMISALNSAVGVTGAAAKALAQKLGASVDISWDAAIKVHRNKVLPRWIGIVQKALPNTGAPNPNQLGALVSLTYNRGASFSTPGDRYTEMRAIKAHMQSSQVDKIPDDIRSMKRLWPDVQGLRDRRDREADLFATGSA
jgi:uncharacterized protein (TIGR02594 family)